MNRKKKNNEDKVVKTILLMRHAKSDWEENVSDFDRPLAVRGKSDAPLIGKFLLKTKKVPSIIISSPAIRAKETSELLAKACRYKVGIRYSDSIYENSPVEIIKILQGLDDKIETAMVIGHNPAIEEAAKKLCFRELKTMDNGIEFPTCALVCLGAEIESWSELYPGNCTIYWFIVPRLIKGLF
ncbi:MAG: histidine phosphatase family protein [Victivallales bacterium]